MKIKTISSTLSVSGQITSEDIKIIKNKGFSSIICNRPDDEGIDQPTFNEISKFAKNAGLEIKYIPITPGKMSDEDVQEFSKAMDKLPKPVLAYCRSGMRSSTLWSLSQANK